MHYIKKTGWVVKKLGCSRFLTTNQGKAEWSDNPSDMVFFNSKDDAEKRISKIKDEAEAVIIDSETKTKKLFSVRVWSNYTLQNSIDIETYEIPIFVDKWDGDLFYDVKNVKKRAENLRNKMLKEKKEELIKLQKEISNLESMVIEDLVSAEIIKSLDRLEYRKKIYGEMKVEAQKREDKKQKRLAKKASMNK
jgi:hypothetical protein